MLRGRETFAIRWACYRKNHKTYTINQFSKELGIVHSKVARELKILGLTAAISHKGRHGLSPQVVEETKEALARAERSGWTKRETAHYLGISRKALMMRRRHYLGEKSPREQERSIRGT